jgi:low temperature requirement protein LtrA
VTVEGDEGEQLGPLIRPPDLNRESNRRASVLELFFDLAFVLAIERVGARLLAEPSWGQAGVCACLVSLIWWAWASSTIYANRFDTDDLVFRLLKLTGMLAVVLVAASVGGVGGADGRWFALAYGVLHLELATQYVRAWRSVTEARNTVIPYLIGHGAGGLLFLASAALPAAARWPLWALGLVVQLAAPLLASRGGETPLHLEHLPERFGLFIILVLGESIASVVTGLEHRHFAAGAVVATALGFSVAAALWWVYFDQTRTTTKRGLLEAGEVSQTGVHDLYLFLHLPIAISLMAVAVGLEQLVEDGGLGDGAASGRWLVAGGTAAFLLSAGLLQGVLVGRRSAAFPAVAAGAALAAGGLPNVGLLLAAVFMVLVGVVAMGRREAHRGRLPTSP